jgi:hypothetical protein
MYVLPASKKCRASWPIKFIKGARPGLKRQAQVTVQQMQKKDLNMKRRKDLNEFLISRIPLIGLVTRLGWRLITLEQLALIKNICHTKK